jgi:putative hydrolase of the HAD superfamily
MIKNIILDLGGVILNIDYHRPVAAFEKLGAPGMEKVFSQAFQIDILNQFEVGAIDAPTFRASLKKILNIPQVSDEAFDQAWNSVLLDFSKAALDFIATLKPKYKVFLLSNTNEINLKKIFEEMISQTYFEGLFDEAYYSCRLHDRKPNPSIFQKILKRHGLKPAETVFVDDSAQHIEGARSVGIHAIHLTPDKKLVDLEKMM